MNQLTPDLFVSLWAMAKVAQAPPDVALARTQKYMVMHDDLHETFDRMQADASSLPEGQFQQVMLHIAMDASTERSLETDRPAGVRAVMQRMLDGGVEPGPAFHAVSGAMLQAFLEGAQAGQEMDPQRFLTLAVQNAHPCTPQQGGLQ